MQERELFSDEESEASASELQPRQKVEVSVLRHIPAALKILDGRNRPCEIYSPRCLYEEELIKTGKHLMPKVEEGVKLAANRLFSIEDALFEYARIRERVKEGGKVQREQLQTLWETYGQRQLYYYRFEPKMRKNNFANVFMNIGGINLQARAKLNNLPIIKNKANSLPAKNNGGLIFDSNFQSGNLLYVYKCDDSSIQSYDLVLQNDINTRGHNQWFYFKITNTKKNQKVRLNIVNLVKKESLFSYGLKPLTLSEKNSRNGVQWVRNGQKVVYEQNNIKRQHKSQCYYTLSFEYEFRQAFDTVYFAPSHPYTYSQLYHYMNGLLQEKAVCNLVSIKKVCESIGKNAINVITISTGRLAAKESKTVWIIGRQHPVETTSSFMVEGIINYLLGLLGKALESDDNFYDGYTFKIVPMLNPDGVIHGNTRAQITGIDPNRVWKKPSKATTPTVYFIKKLIQRSKEQTCLVLDLHSHSKKLGCFFYGNYSQSDTKSFRLLPSSVCEKDPRFNYRSCRFRGGNDNSARKSLFKQLNIANIFTVQCSLLGYLKDNRITEFKISDYHQMGANILDTFLQLERDAHGFEREVKSYPHEEQDCCDAQSARSDSCVSEDEYVEVYQFGVKKKKEHGRSTKPRAITFIEGKEAKAPQAKKGPSSISKVLEVKPENEQDRYATANPQQARLVKADLHREFSIKIRSNKNTKCVRTLFNRKQMILMGKQEPAKRQEGKTYGEKSTQVEQVRNGQQPQLVRIKTEKRLMVVGNSVQDEKIFVGKNEVGVQIYSTTKQNSTAVEESLLPRKTVSNRLNCKMSRRFTDTNQSAKMEKSVKPERKGVLMFRS